MPAITKLLAQRQATLKPLSGGRMIAAPVDRLAKNITGDRLAIVVSERLGKRQALLAKHIGAAMLTQVRADGCQVVQRKDHLGLRVKRPQAIETLLQQPASLGLAAEIEGEPTLTRQHARPGQPAIALLADLQRTACGP